MLARVSPRRISQALRQLRASVPPAPRSGNLRICASGTELVVRDESGPWRTPSGQFLLEFDVTVNESGVEILDRSSTEILETPASAPPSDANADADLDVDVDALFERALAVEESSAEEAIRAYRHCLDANPENVAARVNCGRLLHAAEQHADAESLYRAGIEAGTDDPNLLFNLALVLEDTGRELEAVDLYKRAIALDPDFADAHFNLARLFQHLQMPRAAIRHWNQYRRLTLTQS